MTEDLSEFDNCLETIYKLRQLKINDIKSSSIEINAYLQKNIYKKECFFFFQITENGIRYHLEGALQKVGSGGDKLATLFWHQTLRFENRDSQTRNMLV